MSMTSMEQCKNYYADGSNRYYVVIFENKSVLLAEKRSFFFELSSA